MCPEERGWICYPIPLLLKRQNLGDLSWANFVVAEPVMQRARCTPQWKVQCTDYFLQQNASIFIDQGLYMCNQLFVIIFRFAPTVKNDGFPSLKKFHPLENKCLWRSRWWACTSRLWEWDFYHGLSMNMRSLMWSDYSKIGYGLSMNMRSLMWSDYSKIGLSSCCYLFKNSEKVLLVIWTFFSFVKINVFHQFFAFRPKMHVRHNNQYKTGADRGIILGQPLLFECMGVCTLSLAHECEMRGTLVYLLIVKYLSILLKFSHSIVKYLSISFKFSHSTLDWTLLWWNSFGIFKDIFRGVCRPYNWRGLDSESELIYLL